MPDTSCAGERWTIPIFQTQKIGGGGGGGGQLHGWGRSDGTLRYILTWDLLCVGIPRAQPKGLRNITECIHEKTRRRRARTSLYPGDEIITR